MAINVNVQYNGGLLLDIIYLHRGTCLNAMNLIFLKKMKVFAVERHVLPEDFVSFPALCGVQSSPLRIGRLSGVRYSGRHRESLCASGLRSPELSAQVRRTNSCTSCKPAHVDAYITCTGQND